MAMTRILAACLVLLLTGCYALRPSAGGGQTAFDRPRQLDPADVALLPGYEIEVVAHGLNFPTAVTFDDQGRVHVVEAGYSYGEKWAIPRLIRLEPNGHRFTVAAGGRNGPWTGATFHQGRFYIAEGGVLEGGRILRVDPDGTVKVLVADLPSLGDHHTNGPVIGPDGRLYFGQGTAENSAVVGLDNAQFGWLTRFPRFHSVPGQDITLVGRNFTTANPFAPGSTATTGAYLPFGSPSHAGQVIRGQTKCNGAILRVNPDGTDLELVAWGFRNPFGLAFGPDNRLYVTENGYDDRGSRPLWGTPDCLWRVQPGLWYGWPDFSGGRPVTDPKFCPPGNQQPQFRLAQHPNRPPRPLAEFPVHAAATGLDFSRAERFGFVGDAFVALFGDEAPTVGKVLAPVGFKVVRVKLADGQASEFAVNKGPINGPASRLDHGGLERPIAVRFSPDGQELYIVDFGVLTHGAAGAQPRENTGVLWRVVRKETR